MTVAMMTMPPFPRRLAATLSWAAKMEAPKEVDPGTGYWSTLGIDARPQPDDFSYRSDPSSKDNRENCVAVKNIGGKIGWHDLRCLEKHPVVCEAVAGAMPM